MKNQKDCLNSSETDAFRNVSRRNFFEKVSACTLKASAVSCLEAPRSYADPILSKPAQNQDFAKPTFSLANIEALREFTVRNASVFVEGYYSPGDGGGGIFVGRDSGVFVDNGGSIIARMGTSGAWVRVVQTYITPKMFGAKCDKVTDDTEPAQKAIEFCLRSGVDFRFATGIMRVTSGLKFGRSFLTQLEPIVNRTARWVNVSQFISYSNREYNIANYKSINVSSEAGAIILPDFEPASVKAVVEYNLNYRTGRVEISDLVIACLPWITGSEETTPRNVPAKNNLVGLFATEQATDRISGIKGYGLGKGALVVHAQYWTIIENIYAHACGDAVHVSDGNTITLRNFLAFYSRRALIIDGSCMNISFHTEQALNSLVYLGGEMNEFHNCYFEDEETSDGSGQYDIYVGNGGKQQVMMTTFSNIRTSKVRPNKKKWLIRGASYLTFIGCRSYNEPLIVDTVSEGLLINCDFPSDEVHLPVTKWGRLYSGAAALARQQGDSGVRIIHEDILLIESVSWQEIAAGSAVAGDFRIPARPGGYSHAVVELSVDQDVRGLIFRGRLIDPTKLRITVENTTMQAQYFEGRMFAHIILFNARKSGPQ